MIRRPAGLPAPLAELERTAVMGILNVTPDSFSDGGLYLDPSAAVAHGVELHAAGADVVDIGGESTRPGAQRVPVDEELRRVLPVVDGLVAAGVPVSIDTMRAETAAEAVGAGACLVNDVSGGLADADMYRTVATLGVPYVAMHWRGPSDVMVGLAHYGDVVADVLDELCARLDAAVEAGVDRDAVVLDPGLGFTKDADHNWQLLQHLDDILALGQPVLIGTSRKRFLGSLLATDGVPREMAARDRATDATSALAAARGVWAVRVHDVSGSIDAVRVAQAWSEGGEHA